MFTQGLMVHQKRLNESMDWNVDFGQNPGILDGQAHTLWKANNTIGKSN